jgi:hypothetical protein
MRQGVDKWQAAGFLGMSAELIDCVYGHYLPAHLRGAARAIGYRAREKLVVSLVEERAKIENIRGPGRSGTMRCPKDLAQGEGEKGSLRGKGHFQRRPHLRDRSSLHRPPGRRLPEYTISAVLWPPPRSASTYLHRSPLWASWDNDFHVVVGFSAVCVPD